MCQQGRAIPIHMDMMSSHLQCRREPLDEGRVIFEQTNLHTLLFLLYRQRCVEVLLSFLQGCQGNLYLSLSAIKAVREETFALQSPRWINRASWCLDE